MSSKQIFAIYGSANVGKTTTIIRIRELLEKAYSKAPVRIFNPTTIDITVIIEIKGILIGIESQGDPNSRLPESLKFFLKEKCSIIICATRNWGQTVKQVEKLEPEFKVKWHHKKAEPKAGLREQADDQTARMIFQQVQDALTAPVPV